MYFKITKQKQYVSLHELQGLDHSKRLTAFSFKNCGGMIDVKSLSVKPDPLQFPGTITFSASAALNSTLNAPLNASCIIFIQSPMH